MSQVSQDLVLAFERLCLPLGGTSTWLEDRLHLDFRPYFTSEFLPRSRIFNHGICLLPQSKTSLNDLSLSRDGNTFIVHFSEEEAPNHLSPHNNVELWEKNLSDYTPPKDGKFFSRRAESVPDIELYDLLNTDDRIYPYYPFDPNMEWHIIYNGQNLPVGKFRLTRANPGNMLLTRPFLKKDYEGCFADLIAAAETKLANRGERNISLPVDNPMVARFLQTLGYNKGAVARILTTR